MMPFILLLPSLSLLSDMHDIEAKVRTIEADGLLWGASKLVPLAYGIKKLQISCVVEDDKVRVRVGVLWNLLVLEIIVLESNVFFVVLLIHVAFIEGLLYTYTF